MFGFSGGEPVIVTTVWLALSLIESPIWRNVCIVHIALCVIGAIYLLSIILDLVSTGSASFLVYEEAR